MARVKKKSKKSKSEHIHGQCYKVIHKRIENAIEYLTFIAPTIIIIDMRMVMPRLKAIMIFTIHGGSQSKKMVRYVRRTVSITTMATIDNNMAQTPAIIEPVRNDWHRQQLFNIGFAIFYRFFIVFPVNNTFRTNGKLFLYIFEEIDNKWKIRAVAFIRKNL